MNKESGWKRMTQIAEQSMKDNDYDIEDVKDDLSRLREITVEKGSEEITNRIIESLNEVEKIRKGELPKKSARKFLKKSREEDNQ